ncbi:MAG: hypothetical protein AB1486_10675 [Planctomycetota bacterium]
MPCGPDAGVASDHLWRRHGTGSMGGFKRIAISNCIIKPSLDPASVYAGLPWCGISGISLQVVDGGTMEGITIDNIVMQGVSVPVFIRLGNRGALYRPDAPKPPVGSLRNVTLSNIMASETGAFGSSITGLPGHCVENVVLRNVQVVPRAFVKAGEYRTDFEELEQSYPEATMWQNLPACGLTMRHVRGLSIEGFRLHLAEPDDRAPLWADDVHDLRIRGAWITGESNDERPFVRTRAAEGIDIERPHGWRSEVTAPLR